MKRPKITARQEGGDDGYCYVVRIDGAAFVSGLTRAEVPYYKKQALRRWEERHGDQARTSEAETRPRADGG
jgi:hypothetical protein